MKAKEFLKTFLAGMGMGVASAIPGVSGGTVAVITGIYEKFIGAINNIFKKFKDSILILLPILFGVLVALVPCVFIFDKAFESFVFGLVSLFAGLTIGSFPGILKEVKDVKASSKHIIICVISGLVALGLGILSIVTNGVFNMSQQVITPDWWFYLVCVLFGLLASFALVVPGISGSMLLLVLGFYNPLLDCLKSLLTFDVANIWATLGIVGCFGVGIIGGFILVSKAMGYLLAKHHDITYYSIIGFIIGSTIALFVNKDIFNYYLVWAGNTVEGISPALAWYIEVPIAIILCGAGIFVSNLLLKFSKK